jgi:hypothetical protein
VDKEISIDESSVHWVGDIDDYSGSFLLSCLYGAPFPLGDDQRLLLDSFFGEATGHREDLRAGLAGLLSLSPDVTPEQLLEEVKAVLRASQEWERLAGRLEIDLIEARRERGGHAMSFGPCMCGDPYCSRCGSGLPECARCERKIREEGWCGCFDGGDAPDTCPHLEYCSPECFDLGLLSATEMAEREAARRAAEDDLCSPGFEGNLTDVEADTQIWKVSTGPEE